jgi:hypothetical protein
MRAFLASTILALLCATLSPAWRPAQDTSAGGAWIPSRPGSPTDVHVGRPRPVRALAQPAAPADRNVLLTAITAYPHPEPTDAQFAARYDLVILQSWAAARARTIKHLNPRVKVLFYRAAQVAWDWQEDWGTINAHESWFLHDAAGHRVRNAKGNDPSYLMDIGNPEFRAYQVRYVMRYIKAYGFDGMFWDGPPGAVLGWLSLQPAPAPASVAHWHQDALEFLKEMKQALGSKLLITNSTPTYDPHTPGVDDTDFLAYADGTMIEGFAHAPWEPDTYEPDPQRWVWQQRMAQRNLSRGKYLLVLSGVDGIGHGATARQISRWQDFSYASYLLDADGARAYYQWMYVNFDNFFPDMMAPIGMPLGQAYRHDGLYQRDFTRGTVLVNPTGNTATATLSAAYHFLNGRRVARVALPAMSAVILFK